MTFRKKDVPRIRLRLPGHRQRKKVRPGTKVELFQSAGAEDVGMGIGVVERITNYHLPYDQITYDIKMEIGYVFLSLCACGST